MSDDGLSLEQQILYLKKLVLSVERTRIQVESVIDKMPEIWGEIKKMESSLERTLGNIGTASEAPAPPEIEPWFLVYPPDYDADVAERCDYLSFPTFDKAVEEASAIGAGSEIWLDPLLKIGDDVDFPGMIFLIKV